MKEENNRFNFANGQINNSLPKIQGDCFTEAMWMDVVFIVVEAVEEDECFFEKVPFQNLFNGSIDYENHSTEDDLFNQNFLFHKPRFISNLTNNPSGKKNDVENVKPQIQLKENMDLLNESLSKHIHELEKININLNKIISRTKKQISKELDVIEKGFVSDHKGLIKKQKSKSLKKIKKNRHKE